MIAFGLASIMLCIGMIIRTKVPSIQNMLVPASVLAGVLGFLVMNTGLITAVSHEMYIDIVNYLFTITFISLALTRNTNEKDSTSTGKRIAKGSLSLGLLWNLLFALIPVIGALVILLIGGFFNMDPVYGLMITFAFTQGPGQSATFGTIMEQQYGIANAATVGVTFASIGFLICFLVGVPLAKYGIKKGLAKNLGASEVQGFIRRGYYSENDRKESLGEETMFSGNIDTMTFHFAIIGLCFLLALGMSELVSYIPGIGATFSGMLFMFGMLAGYLVKYIMKKLNIMNMLDNTFQSKITGWSTDYLVVASFMAVPFSVVGAWLFPIIVEAIIVTAFILAVCIYFGQRLGSEYDFERTIGLYGSATGTVPSGIALVRIIDPSLRTSTAIELGMMNIMMVFSYVSTLTILSVASGVISLKIGLLLLLAPIPVYLIILKVGKMWGSKTYDLKQNQPNRVSRSTAND